MKHLRRIFESKVDISVENKEFLDDLKYILLDMVDSGLNINITTKNGMSSTKLKLNDYIRNGGDVKFTPKYEAGNKIKNYFILRMEYDRSTSYEGISKIMSKSITPINRIKELGWDIYNFKIDNNILIYEFSKPDEEGKELSRSQMEAKVRDAFGFHYLEISDVHISDEIELSVSNGLDDHLDRNDVEVELEQIRIALGFENVDFDLNISEDEMFVRFYNDRF